MTEADLGEGAALGQNRRMARAETDLHHAFVATQISTPIARAQTVGFHEPPLIARDRLKAGGFDQAPVMRGKVVLGWVATDGLSQAPRIKSSMHDLSQTPMVAAGAPLVDALRQIGRSDLVFTVGNQGVEGMITKSDLERHAVRAYLYVLISGIELCLADLVDSRIDRKRVIEEISEDMSSRWEKDVRAGREARPVEYLYFSSLVQLFAQLEIAEGLTPDETHGLKRIAEFLRNRVMHPTKSLLGQMEAASLVGLADQADRILSRVVSIADESMTTPGGFNT
jgi:hypothetical protein